MSPSLKIAIAEDDRYAREYYETTLKGLGHHVTVVETGRELVDRCRLHPPDLVISDIKMPEMDGIEAVERVCKVRPVPAILISAHSEPPLIERAASAPVLGYLIKPVTADDFPPAIALALRRFAEFQALYAEAASLRQALEERKVIERAKGALMLRLHLSEEDAYRRLRQQASNSNTKLVEIAQEIVEADNIFRALDTYSPTTKKISRAPAE